jgi:hypothetical protein
LRSASRVARLDPAFVPWGLGAERLRVRRQRRSRNGHRDESGVSATVAIAVALDGLATLAFRAPAIAAISPRRARRR